MYHLHYTDKGSKYPMPYLVENPLLGLQRRRKELVVQPTKYIYGASVELSTGLVPRQKAQLHLKWRYYPYEL